MHYIEIFFSNGTDRLVFYFEDTQEKKDIIYDIQNAIHRGTMVFLKRNGQLGFYINAKKISYLKTTEG